MSKIPALCEEGTFSKIFQENIQSLYHFLFYKTGNEALAKDAAQEAFTKLWQNCAAVVLENAKAYVYKTATNLIINEHRHQQIVLKFQNQQKPTKSLENPQYLLEEKEFQQKLELVINNLPEKQRIVFLMSRIDKKTYKEIAEIVGISKKAVEKRMYQALDTLRTAVSEKIP